MYWRKWTCSVLGPQQRGWRNGGKEVLGDESYQRLRLHWRWLMQWWCPLSNYGWWVIEEAWDEDTSVWNDVYDQRGGRSHKVMQSEKGCKPFLDRKHVVMDMVLMEKQKWTVHAFMRMMEMKGLLWWSECQTHEQEVTGVWGQGKTNIIDNIWHLMRQPRVKSSWMFGFMAGVNVRGAGIKEQWRIFWVTPALRLTRFAVRVCACKMFGRLVLFLVGAVPLVCAIAPNRCTIPATIREGWVTRRRVGSC